MTDLEPPVDAFDEALVGMMMADPTGRFTRANRAACELLGYTEDELRGLHVTALSHPEDREESRRNLDRLHAGELSSFVTEKRYLRKDGTPVWVQLGARAVRGEDGAIRYFISHIEDISALHESEERFRRLVENAQDVVLRYRVGPEPAYDYVSPSVRRLFGIEPEELYANPELGLEVVHPDDRAALLAAFERDPEEPVTARVVRPDGSLVWAERRQIAVRDENGTIVALEAIVRDVTERERRQRQLQAVFESSSDAILVVDEDGRCLEANPAAQELFGTSPAGHVFGELVDGDAVPRPDGEVRSVELRLTREVEPGRQLIVLRDVTELRRAAELDERLQQGEKMRAVGQVAAGVAHDFNNLLTVINGYSDLALDDADAGVRERLVEIRRAGERAADLTRQLLAFSRKQVLNPETLDINRFVADQRNMLQRVLGEDVQIVLEVDDAPLCVRADPTQVVQVLLNLSVNARDAMPGGGTLTITTGRDGDDVALHVADSGQGIDPHAIGRIFEPFFTTKPVGLGTGLGLSTVLGIVEQSGGSIDVESRLGDGTTFSIYLPAVDAEPREPPARRADASLPGGTALVVEDNDLVRPLLERYLTSLGYEVVSAAAPGAALQLAEEHGRFDLLVTDVVMPEMNGQELASQLRERQPDLSVLFLSGYTADAVIERGALGASESFLQKPFTVGQLAHALAALSRES